MPGTPFGLEDSSGHSPLNLLDVSFLEDLQTLHIPTNKKREVQTQYRLLLSFLVGYFSSFTNKFEAKEDLQKKPEIRKYHRPDRVYSR